MRQLEIPSEEFLDKILYQYNRDNEQIVKNENAVEDLEKQIDELVYKLYDILYTERRIIEDYLTKF